MPNNKIQVFGLGLIFLLSACSKGPDIAPPPAPEVPMSLKVPEHGAYTGAYMDFGDYEDEVSIEKIEDFEKLVGKHQAIIASSSYWGEQTFPTENLNLIWRHNSIPLLFWSPWDKPYEEDSGPDKFSLNAILEGKWDAYIDRWADDAKMFGQPIFVSFCNEMNGSWFPWAGAHYGAGTIIPNSSPLAYEGPELFKKAYRHVVDRVRARGAKNILWVFHVMDYSIPVGYLWNTAAAYYPGDDYVDWMGLSVYGQQYLDDRWSPFLPLVEWPCKELSLISPNKPIMLAEWGCGEYPQSGSKAQFIKDAFELMEKKFPNIKAAVFWHERWQNDDSDYSNLKANSSPEALQAYREGVARPYWLEQPVLAPAK